MPQELICPHCGQGVPLDSPREPIDTFVSLDVAHTTEMIIPGTICADDLMLEYASMGSGGGGGSGGVAAPPLPGPPGVGDDEPAIPGAGGPGSDWGGGSSEFDPLASPVADPVLEAFARDDPEANGSDPDGHPVVSPTATAPSAPDDADDDDGPAGTDWPMVLLGSYASAVTIALAVLLWMGFAKRPTTAPTLPNDSRIDPARRAASLPALADDRRVAIGHAVTVGSLEITPEGVEAGPVNLVRPDGGHRDGGPAALILKLRLKNVSADATFAPLDPEFVRNPDRGLCDTLIETPSGPVEMYPLSVASEQRIEGQSFAALKPGEGRGVVLVSEADSRAKAEGAMTWRVRLRVDPDHSIVLGVPFSGDEVK